MRSKRTRPEVQQVHLKTEVKKMPEEEEHVFEKL